MKNLLIKYEKKLTFKLNFKSEFKIKLKTWLYLLTNMSS